ncbi:D-tyrosyl-tRNA(Tyr) deacylase [Ruminococcaceae bacterium OttesenSCG-928-D13]|nr:D-tyrosyl-tRNA(Tyr) deacylase [Ruminococcaceae bacterium OttesenSCG-928-D13]
MRALVQRVSRASVIIDGKEKREIGPGLVVLLGVKETDELSMCKKLAEKTAGLRIFDDDEGKLNVSAVDKGYSALVVSQFTLYGDTKKGKRPSFITAAKPPLSVDCYEEYLRQLKTQGLAEVQTGAFGADMQVEIHNDGPVTILLDTDEWRGPL